MTHYSSQTLTEQRNEIRATEFSDEIIQRNRCEILRLQADCHFLDRAGKVVLNNLVKQKAALKKSLEAKMMREECQLASA